VSRDPVDESVAEIARLRYVVMSLREELEATADSGKIPRPLVAGIMRRMEEESGLLGAPDRQ
jgi:hypothetical protein